MGDRPIRPARYVARFIEGREPMLEQSSATRIFPNRCAAGRALGAELAPLDLQRPVVLALPRGGVPVGYEVAHLLGAPLDVLVVRKIGAPGQPEFAIGAVASGVTVFDDELLSMLGIGADYFEAAARRERLEAQRREAAFREGRPPLDLRDRAAILVDDGLATGSTMLAAVAVARKLGAAHVIVAVPVGARQACDRLAERADRVVCLAVPEPFGAVGVWYKDFTQTDDAEVRRLLRLARLEQEAHYQPAAGTG
jgi:predicted phosphoribosyltransferase